MGWVESFFSALKAEVESLITVVVGSGGEAAESGDSQQSDSADTSHSGSDSAPDTKAAILSLADQQTDNTAGHSETQHATGDAILSPTSDAQLADVATGLPADLLPSADSLIDTTGHQQIALDGDTQNAGSDPQPASATHNPLLLKADFLIDTTDHSAPAPSESGISGPSGTSAIAAAPANQDFALILSGNDIHSGISSALLDAGEFALASAASQFYSFAQGGSGGGGGGGSGGTSNGGDYSHHDITSVGGTCTLILHLDNSLYNLNRTNPSLYASISGDLQKVVNFFASHFNDSTTDVANGNTWQMNVGWGEANSSALPSGALGASQDFIYAVPYSKLQTGDGTASGTGGFNGLVAAETANGSQAVNIPGSEPFSSSNPTFMLSAQQIHALGVTGFSGLHFGGIGFSSAAGKFFFDPAHPVAGEYDFMGIAIHEITEQLGRLTLNGTLNASGSPQLSLLDLFHFADPAPGAATYSGTTPGYFSVDNGTTNLVEFNNNSSNGDFGDWATTTDAFSANPSAAPTNPTSANSDLTFTYNDYLAMEAVGWAGTYSGTPSNWDSSIAPTI